MSAKQNLTSCFFFREMARLRQQDMEDEQADEAEDHVETDIIVLDEAEDMPHLWDEEARKAAFQAQYSKEMARQVQLLHIDADTAVLSSPPKLSTADEDRSVAWEDA